MKTCTKCGGTKPTTEFSKRAASCDGLAYHCKACVSIGTAKYYAENTETIKAGRVKWNTDNPGKKKAACDKWNAANTERKKATNAKWNAANLEPNRIRSHNRRARKRENGGTLSKGLADKLFVLQKGKCACCGKPLGKNYHLDHIMPIRLGGANIDLNIQLLRQRCNNQKHAKHPIDFMQQRGFLL